MTRWKTRAPKRRFLIKKQRGLCDCCGCPMWESSIETRDAFRARMAKAGIVLDLRDVVMMRCTFEHVVPISRGSPEAGRLAQDVATCATCNSERGDLPYERFRQLTRRLGSAEKAAAEMREASRRYHELAGRR